MRGHDHKQSMLFSTISPERRVPEKHPLRRVKALADAALTALSPTFDAMYGRTGRPSIPPERLLKASLLMAFYTVRSERLFCEQLDYNLLFRWFMDMNMDEESFDHSTFSKNRQRLIEHEVAEKFFAQIVLEARRLGLMSSEHFTVDGTLIEAWASLKSFRRKDGEGRDDPPDDPGNPSVDFHGEKRSNETHASTTDPEAKLARKSNGVAARLSYSLHALMENRHGLLVGWRVAAATGKAERETALSLLDDELPGSQRLTLGADKGYDTRDFVAELRRRNVTPHIAQNNTRRRSAIDARTTRHPGFVVSQRVRKRVEEAFGWMKTVGNFRRTRFKGETRTQHASQIVGAAFNLLRIAKLTEAYA